MCPSKYNTAMVAMNPKQLHLLVSSPNIQLWKGKGLIESTYLLNNYWKLTDYGWRGSIVASYVPTSYTLVDNSKPKVIETGTS